ncbi:hypothetical protein F8178_04705 [Haloechinothrix sp. LS1_15]|nr:hypothetical protein [Haloechinothrix sp. LS1_15]
MTSQPEGVRQDDPHAASVRRLAAAMLRTGLLFGAAAGAVSVVVAAVLAGWTGLIGAVIGVAVAFASSLVTVGMMHLTAALPPESLLGVVLGGYTLKIVALLVVMVTLRDVPVLDPMALGLTVLVTVIAWAVAEVVAFRRTKIPTIIPAGGGSS